MKPSLKQPNDIYFFGIGISPTGFYFFHDSPTEEVKSAYTAKYEPKYNYPAARKN